MKLSREAAAMKKMFDVVNFVTQNKRLPAHSVESVEESRLHAWINAMKVARVGKNKLVFYPVLTDLVEKFGLPDLFITKTTDELNIEILERVIAYAKSTNTTPSVKHENDDVKALGIWLRGIRKSKLGKGDASFTPELEQAAIKAGYPNIFDMPKPGHVIRKRQADKTTNSANEAATKPISKTKQPTMRQELQSFKSEMQDLRKMFTSFMKK